LQTGFKGPQLRLDLNTWHLGGEMQVVPVIKGCLADLGFSLKPMLGNWKI